MLRLRWMGSPTLTQAGTLTDSDFSPPSSPPAIHKPGGFFMGIGMRIEVGRRWGLFGDYLGIIDIQPQPGTLRTVCVG